MPDELFSQSERSHLLRDLNSRNSAVREEAIRRARKLPSDLLLELFIDEAKRLGRNRALERKLDFVIRCVVLILCLMPISKPIFRIILIAWWSDISFRKHNQPSRRLSSLAQCLQQPERMDTLPLLLELGYEFRETPVQHSLQEMTLSMLAHLRPEHVATWTKPQKATLLLPLKPTRRNRPLALATLNALEQVGDAEAIPAVEKLTQEKVRVGLFIFTNIDEQVRAAAQECLPYLYINADQARQTQTLLRPAMNTAETSESLLRPAMENPQPTDPEQLLRPSP